MWVRIGSNCHHYLKVLVQTLLCKAPKKDQGLMYVG
jgi:hypothetical protein